MAKAWQLDGPIEQLHAHESAAFRQGQLADALPVVVWQMLAAFGGIRPRFQGRVAGTDREGKAGAKSVSGAHQVAEVQGLGDALRSNGEVTPGGQRRYWLVHDVRPLSALPV